MYNDFTNSKEKEIIITTTDAKLINKKVSDTVTIEAYGLKREYKIAGIIEGKLYNGGLFALIKNTDLKEDFGINSANSILLSTNKDQEEVKEEIKKSISEFGASIVTSNDSKKNDEEANEMLVNILSIFAYMAVIIASLGVLNNITIGFIQRKRDFAVLSSVGMRKSKRNLMLIVESCISVIWSLIFAVSIIKLELSLVTKFLKVINMPLKIELDVYSIPMCFIISLIVILLATLPVIFKSKKLSIIEELKYE